MLFCHVVIGEHQGRGQEDNELKPPSLLNLTTTNASIVAQRHQPLEE